MAETVHHCHRPRCETPVPPAQFACRPHWFELPRALRDAIWAAYEPGQEITKDPSPEYVEAAVAADRWYREKDAAREKPGA